jgi:hypothetical protein
MEREIHFLSMTWRQNILAGRLRRYTKHGLADHRIEHCERDLIQRLLDAPGSALKVQILRRKIE